MIPHTYIMISRYSSYKRWYASCQVTKDDMPHGTKHSRRYLWCLPWYWTSPNVLNTHYTGWLISNYEQALLHCNLKGNRDRIAHCNRYDYCDKPMNDLNPIWHGGPKMFLTTLPKRLGGGSWNLMTFNINLCSIKKSYFWFPMLSDVTMATSLSGRTRDFLKLLFHTFPNNEILKVYKSKIWVDIWKQHPKVPPNTKFLRNHSGV